MAVLSSFLCGIILPLFLSFTGIFFLFKLRFFYILHPIKLVKSSFSAKKGAFKSLCIALGGTLGVGNIVGVGSAILMGGYGSVFWMVLSAFLAMGIKYAEVFLAMRAQRQKGDVLYGGAPYYIYDGFEKRLGKKGAYLFGSLFAAFCVINSFTTGNLVQINSVSSLLPINKLVFGMIFAFLVFLAVFKGVKSIGRVSSFIIPALSLFYFVLCTVLIVLNISKVPSALHLIIKGAFSPSCAFFGVSGYGISAAIRYGFSRGLLSNEAGSGTSPTAHASSSAGAHTQGCLGIFEVFVDTVVLCTLTALVIIISGAEPSSDGMSLVLSAFYRLSGNIGKFGVYFACLFFAFATVTTQYFYGKESLYYISRSRTLLLLFNFLFFIIIIVGAIIPINIMWQISDLALAVMTIFNLLCILILNKKVAV